MSFATGFVTGLAKSVDDQLKNDMLRTQKRMDGMEQYRVTRRRADKERKTKELDEVADLIRQFASFTGGDIDKAKQLYDSQGGTITGGTAFYKTLDENRNSLKDFDINTIADFKERTLSEDVTFNDLAKNYVKGVNRYDNEPIKASGLLSIFDRGKFGEQVDKRVDEQAPIGSSADYGKYDSTPATIKRGNLIQAIKYEKDNRRKYGSNYVEDLISLEEAYSYETDDTKKKDLNAKIKKRRADIIAEAAGKNKDSKTSFFSKPNRDTIVKSAISSTMRKYEKKGIDGTITIALEGNEVDIFNSKATAISNLVKTWSPAGDAFLNQDITNEQTILNNEIKAYKLDNYADKNKRTEKFVNVTSMAEALAKTKPTIVNGKVTKEAEIKKGQMVINPEGVIKLWNGEEWI
tara:strand:+ start:235 stop:1452 length:1218 start_codon:yes stop_codon:yes gene_type:complete